MKVHGHASCGSCINARWTHWCRPCLQECGTAMDRSIQSNYSSEAGDIGELPLKAAHHLSRPVGSAVERMSSSRENNCDAWPSCAALLCSPVTPAMPNLFTVTHTAQPIMFGHVDMTLPMTAVWDACLQVPETGAQVNVSIYNIYVGKVGLPGS